MLEKITGTFSGIIRKISGKSTITEKNIEEAVDEIINDFIDNMEVKYE